MKLTALLLISLAVSGLAAAQYGQAQTVKQVPPEMILKARTLATQIDLLIAQRRFQLDHLERTNTNFKAMLRGL